MVYELTQRTCRTLVSAARLVALTTLTLGAAGCDRSDDETGRTRYCSTFCEELEGCDDGTDLLDCKKHCEADEVHSDAYFQARSSCAASSACNLWSMEVDSQGDDVCTGDCFLTSCTDRKLDDVKLSASDERACTAMANALSNCDGTLDRSAISSECERITPALSASYRDESQLCAESTCAEIQSCLDDLAEKYDTELKVFPGTVTR